MKEYKRAISLDNKNFIAAIKAAKLARKSGKTRKCRGIIEESWCQCPPFKYAEQLAEIYISTFDIKSDVETLDYFQKLKEIAPKFPDQYRVEAHLAIKSQLWSRARQSLSKIKKDMHAEDYMLIANIESGEGNIKKQTYNLEKALQVMLQERK